MRNTLIALTLGLCSLPSLATTLAEQFALMEKGAQSALDTRQFSHDGVDIKAWIDGAPVIIAVPILNEQGKQRDNGQHAEEAQLFRDDREQEVGMRLGQVEQLFDAGAQADTKQFASPESN